jgi:hypothetical protein
MVTEVPTGPLNGRKARIVGTGDGVTSKLSRLASVPLGVLSHIHISEPTTREVN